MTGDPIGSLLDTLGVRLQLQPDQHVTEVVVVAKVVDFAADDGIPALAVAQSKGLDWIARRGLLTAGVQMLDDAGTFVCDHDDD